MGLDNEHTIFEAALVGAAKGAKMLNLERSRRSGPPGKYLINASHRKIQGVVEKQAGAKVVMRWVPGHEGVKGNKRADEGAKKAVRGETSQEWEIPIECQGTLPISRAAEFQRHNMKLKQEAWTVFAKSPRAMFTHEIDPTMPSAAFSKITKNIPHRQDRKDRFAPLPSVQEHSGDGSPFFVLVSTLQRAEKEAGKEAEERGQLHQNSPGREQGIGTLIQAIYGQSLQLVATQPPSQLYNGQLLGGKHIAVITRTHSPQKRAMPSSTDPPPTAASQPRTRASNQQGGSKSRAELLADPYAAVRTKEGARTYLDRNGYFARDEPITMELLSYTLLSLAHSAMVKTLQEGARAIAILMLEEAAKSMGETVAMYVGEKMKSVLDKMEQVSETAMNLTEAAQVTAQEAARQMSEAHGSRREMSREEEHGGAEEHQILIDSDPRAEKNVFDELNEQELVAKANKAANEIETSENVGEMCFIGVKKLANGGIVFDLTTNTAARWIQANKATFLEKFSATATIKDRELSVIIEYVPVSHSPEAFTEMRKIERNSRLPSSTLIATR
ncbi:hypothetical protein JB92DRAFT_3124897 [Gautieria morchelliformis]|nr:hypothetical protein JB92DRAFT_3124897 [Gautieria morchelliformis]